LSRLRNSDLSQDTETPSNFLANLQDVLFQAGQIIDIRLALLIGLLAFFVAVGFDSSGHQAEAADLLRQTQASFAPAITVIEGGNLTADSDINGFTGQGINSDPASLATAQRLRHGILTGARMTSSRLTQAHFFTDLPSSR
jgi:hypothetical protein